ncbi:hypothetical protein U9M48_026753 [Paspalum notatum var. saurae]|uniref:Uncharacterized protein n=1 Tax=Paspalum notatum var. saurae TaxID=547442 RepID=A0AAQ3TY54_PASNO
MQCLMGGWARLDPRSVSADTDRDDRVVLPCRDRNVRGVIRARIYCVRVGMDAAPERGGHRTRDGRTPTGTGCGLRAAVRGGASGVLRRRRTWLTWRCPARGAERIRGQRACAPGGWCRADRARRGERSDRGERTHAACAARVVAVVVPRGARVRAASLRDTAIRGESAGAATGADEAVPRSGRQPSAACSRARASAPSTARRAGLGWQVETRQMGGRCGRVPAAEPVFCTGCWLAWPAVLCSAPLRSG